MSILHGYELEFGCKVSQRIREIKLPDGFVSGTDYSANFGMYRGYELRSSVFEEFPVDKFKKCLKISKNKGGRIHKMCGFHIHFSGYEFKPEELNKKLIDIKRWNSREQYAKDHAVYPGFRDKYCRLRRVENDHWECRVFNASLSIRALTNYDRTLRRLIMTSRIIYKV